MLVDSGNLGIRNLLATYITQVGYGSSSTPVTGTDTALQNQVLNPVTSITNLSGGRFLVVAQVDASDPAMTVQEVGLFNGVGTLLFRALVAPYNKVAGVSNTINYEVTVS